MQRRAESCPTRGAERPALIPVWAEGALAAWDANRRHWLGSRLGKTGKGVRAMLEKARDGGEIDLPGLQTLLPRWGRKNIASRTG